MGFEPYTTEELFDYYQQNIGEFIEFNVNHIYFVDNLQTIANKYNINESCENMNGFTIPLDGYIVEILNNLNGFDSMIALFHELTHVRDFICFSRKNSIDNIHQNNLYYALQIYSEINAHYLGNKLTINFLSKNNLTVKQYMYSSMNLADTLQTALCCKKMDMESIARCLGHILLYDDFYQIDNHISHIPDSASLRLRGAIQSLLDAYFDNNIEEIDSIIHLLTV